MSSIYFIRSGETDWIKIGHATNVKQRVRGLQCGNPENLTLLGTIIGGAREEASLHLLLSGTPRRGEWFQANHLVTLMLNLVQHGFDFTKIEEALTAYREATGDLGTVKAIKAAVKKYRLGLVDPQNTRPMKQFMAARLPALRRELTGGRAALERSRNRLIEALSA